LRAVLWPGGRGQQQFTCDGSERVSSPQKEPKAELRARSRVVATLAQGWAIEVWDEVTSASTPHIIDAALARN
jgi:hypothetical protein